MRSEVAVQGFPVTGRGGAMRSGRLRPWVVVLLAGAAVAVGCVAVLPGATTAPTATTRHGLTSLPLAAQDPVSAALGQDDPLYRVNDLRAANPAQRLRAGFSRGGVAVVSGKGQVGLALSAYGYGNALRAVGFAVPRARANRVTYAHGALSEWYVNGPLGIEQGFDVAARPGTDVTAGPGTDVAARSGAAAGPLTLSLTLSGNLAARLQGDSLLLTGHGAALRYGDLRATDARGHVLRSWLQLVNGHVLIRVADRGARYPVRIDPMIQQGAKFTGAGAVGTGRFAYSVAVSADGKTALVGAHYANPDAGAAWVFVRSGSTWTQQGGKLVGTGHAGPGEFAHVGEGEFGYSVALSAGGDTALIGAPTDNSSAGAAWVFTRSGSTWSQQGEKLTGGTPFAEFGTSVALSGDGTTALIGGPNDSAVGAAWVFVRSGSTWAQQGAKLTGEGEAEGGNFGFSVALSENGDTALVGGSRDNNGVGAVWVFARSVSTWTEQGEKLTGEGETGKGELGTSVALSADGNTALVGGPADNGDVGAAWVFTRLVSTWTEQGAKLTGEGETGKGEFGESVALSADSNTALVGGPADNGDVGAAWVFTRLVSIWSQQEKLTGESETGEGEFGYSVALSENGDTALVGGPEDATATGAAWVFTRSETKWSQQGEKLTGGEEANDEFGVLVALSADGNTALIGGWNDDGRRGAAWVFTRSGGVWSQQGGKLTGEGEIGAGGFGTSVALSADGNTALIGAPGDNGTKGAAWVFTRSGSTWTQQGEKLTGGGETGAAWFGYTVALSGDGKTALAGGWLDSSWKGAAWVFTRSGSTWTQQGEKLTGGEEIGQGMFATNVALSADGNTALIGGWNDDNVGPGDKDYSGKGAAWVFTRSGATWSQQGPKLTGAGETGEGKFGTIVALSADGNTALIGGWNDDTSKGAAWVFTRTGSTWSDQGGKLTGGGETGEGRFGVAVALSADGNTALVGGLADNSARGAAWLFVRSGSTWTQQGAKITPTDGAGEGEFGTNVALSADGDTALVGGWRDNGGVGAAWAFVNSPTATTGAASALGETGATLNGTLGAGGSSTAYFQYGTTASYGASTPTQSVGASGSPSPLVAAISGLAPETTYHFRLVAENSGGVSYGSDQTFTTQAPGKTSTTETTTTASTQPTPPTPPITTPSPAPNPTSVPPVVQNARQSTTRWRAGNRLPHISRAKAPTGTTFSFALNEQATVTFSFTHRISGRKVGGKCVAQTAKNRRKASCTRVVTAGTLSFAGHSGTNQVAFQGRVSPARKLGPGRYTLAITATNSAGVRSAPQSLSFAIVK